MAPPDPRPDHEAIYQLLYERRWATLLDVLHRHHTAIAADALLDRAVETFLNVLFRALEQEDGVAERAEVLEKLFLLHQGRQYRLPADRYARVVEGLVNAHAARPEAAVGYARFCPESPACAAVLRRYGAAEPSPVPHTQQDTITLAEHRPLSEADHTISLFKSQQEADFFLAARDVFATYFVYPNVALSSLIDFDRIKDRLSAAERQYFFRGLVDCVVFDQHDAYRPLYFFELDSPLHEAAAQRTRDGFKARILALAGRKLYRVRSHARAASREGFATLIKEVWASGAERPHAASDTYPASSGG